MKLVPIPGDQYEDYRLRLMFDCYKWDPQFLDSNTIAKYALVITREEHEELVRLTEQLDVETRAAEEFLNHNLNLAGPLALPKKVSKEIRNMANYEVDKHIRLMRYDFHPTIEGKWAVSEVNSDVPGGFAESSVMPEAAMDLLKGENYWYKNFGDILVKAFAEKVVPGGRIMLVHCTSYSDDRQVMQFLGDRLKAEGFHVIYAAADHLRFQDNEAFSILDGNEGKVDAIFRFTPLEWLTDIKPKRWQGYFDTVTVSCNHPVAMFAQTKRFPLVWDVLEQKGISMTTWRELLPETVEVKEAKGREGFIYKPACGRVGEKISIKEACRDDEYEKIMADVKKHPKKYLAQKRFNSKPLTGENGEEFHVCLGSYTVEGKHAGYYARISKSPRIDSNAADIPVLICADNEERECRQAFDEKENLIGNLQGELLSAKQEGSVCRELYEIWAPAGKKWVDWVRPVPFVEMGQHSKMYSFSNNTLPTIDFPGMHDRDAAIIVDLPGAESVKEGIALAHAGYRPIPIYNGTIEQQGARATVDNQSVGIGLRWGAAQLRQIEIADDALPAFLLDTNRMQRFKMAVSVFDNSWDVYPQDLPSAEYFLKNDIRKIIVIGNALSKDLKKILYPFRKKGIEIFLTGGYEAPKKVTLHRPLSIDKD